MAWKKHLDHLIVKLPITTHKIVEIQLLTQFSVYHPTRSGAMGDFREALDQLDAALGLYGLDSDVFVMGGLKC